MMAMSRRGFVCAAAIFALAGAVFARPDAARAEPVRIGELTSYAKFASFNEPYRNGWRLALEEINAAGGVLGEPLEIVSRDDGGTTGDAVRVAEELVVREEADILMGTFLSNVGLAVADYAAREKTVFFATEPLTDALTLDKGNAYTFRIRPNTYMQTRMLVDAVKASGAKRWAIVVPNYEYGQSAAENFKKLIADAILGAEIVAEQYPALGKIDAGVTVAALAQAEPDAIFNVLFGGDLASFVREGKTRGLFEGKTIASLLTGEPEWLLPLGSEIPDGWIVTGYPWQQIEVPAHREFVEKYRAAYDETPRLGSLLGYMAVHMLKAGIEKAGAAEADKLIPALEGLQTDTVIGPVTLRAADHQSTMGAWVGSLVDENGEGVMSDWQYYDGDNYMTPLDEVKARRPQ